MLFTVFVDADSVKKDLRTIILNASVRLKCPVVFVADRMLKDVRLFIERDTSRLRTEMNDRQNRSIKSAVQMIVVETGMNSADEKIISLARKNDLCITHDIILAGKLVLKGCFVIDDRGNEFNSDNIKSRIMDRNVNEQLREMGVFDNQSNKTGMRALHDFASTFDRITSYLSKDVCCGK